MANFPAFKPAAEGMRPDVAARWADPTVREHLLMAARAAEREPTLLGVSAHMMVAGRRPPAGMR